MLLDLQYLCIMNFCAHCQYPRMISTCVLSIPVYIVMPRRIVSTFVYCEHPRTFTRFILRAGVRCQELLYIVSSRVQPWLLTSDTSLKSVMEEKREGGLEETGVSVSGQKPLS